MESGFDPIKLLIIVLIVAVQGVSAFRAWVKKREQAKRQEEERLGFPDRDGSAPSTDPSAASDSDDSLMDWDPLGENEPEPIPEREPPPRRPPQDQRPGTIVFPPVGQETETVRKPSGIVFPPPESAPVEPARNPVSVDPEHTHAASETTGEGSHAFVLPQHHLFQESGRRQERQDARLPGNTTLRNAMLARLVLERPLSARVGYPRAVRD